MPKLIDITGQRFGRLTVEAKGPSWKHGTQWYCRCDCGNRFLIRKDSLTSGNTRSCGCLSVEVSRELGRAVGQLSNPKHGQSRPKSPTYQSWTSMKRRAALEGARVHGPWQVFENFLADLGERPPRMILTRENPYGDWTPENCRWATKSEHSVNVHYRRAGALMARLFKIEECSY